MRAPSYGCAGRKGRHRQNRHASPAATRRGRPRRISKRCSSSRASSGCSRRGGEVRSARTALAARSTAPCSSRNMRATSSRAAASGSPARSPRDHAAAGGSPCRKRLHLPRDGPGRRRGPRRRSCPPWASSRRCSAPRPRRSASDGCATGLRRKRKRAARLALPARSGSRQGERGRARPLRARGGRGLREPRRFRPPRRGEPDGARDRPRGLRRTDQEPLGGDHPRVAAHDLRPGDGFGRSEPAAAPLVVSRSL